MYRSNCKCIIDQHPDTQFFEPDGDIGAIVVAQNTHNSVTGLNSLYYVAHARIDRCALSLHFKAIIAC